MTSCPEPVRRFPHAAIIGGAIAVWVLALGVGTHQLLMFSSTPAVVSAGLERWPDSLVTSAPGAKPLLVMFLHPHCACSRASISELAVVMAAARGALDGRVYLLRISGAEEGWEQTDLLRSVRRVPGVEAIIDVDGLAARDLRATVSGETSLYAVDGRRVFHGGLTAARGHEGDNAGSRSVLAWLANPIQPPRTTPVYGCYLHESVAGS